MSEPIEPPPPPPKTVPKYAIVDYVFQFITVTAGVLIALLINGLVEWNHNRELVAEARATIAAGRFQEETAEWRYNSSPISWSRKRSARRG